MKLQGFCKMISRIEWVSWTYDATTKSQDPFLENSLTPVLIVLLFKGLIVRRRVGSTDIVVGIVVVSIVYERIRYLSDH